MSARSAGISVSAASVAEFDANLTALVELSEQAGHGIADDYRRDQGRRPVFGGTEKMQQDPEWHDLIPFHEYFHGDNGAGLGASHQTGWTGLVASLLSLLGNEERFTERHAKRGQARR